MYLKYMRKVLWGQKKYILGLIIFICLGGLVTTILPMVHQNIINDVFVKNDFSDFYLFMVVMTVMYLLQCIFALLKDYFQAKTDADIKLLLRKELNDSIAKKQYAEYLMQGNEQVITRYTNDANVISHHFSEEIFDLLEQSVILVLAIYMVCKISAVFLLGIVVFLGIYYVVSKKIGEMLQKAIKKLQIRREQSLGCFTENYTNNMLVKVNNLYEWIGERFLKVYQREYAQSIKTDIIYSSSINIAKFIVNSLVICSWAVSGYYIRTGKGTIGDIVALTEYIGLLVSPIFYFGQFNNSLQGVNASIERLEEEFSVPSEKVDVGESLTGISEISLRDIEFQYKSGTFQMKIDRLDMKKGEIIGLKGESGCGKTTLVNLLMQLYVAGKGTIYINNKDYRTIKLSDIRACIGYVPQDSIFFEGTIRENLFGNFAQEDIERLSAELDLFHDIQRMDNGYEYILKKNASNISGGQQKRIDALRVLLADKDVIIFDEATAMLDKKRRDAFFELITKLKKEKIIIMITHNNSEWDYFDKTYEM